DGTPSELAFSPDEKSLLWHHGPALVVLKLDGSGQPYGLNVSSLQSPLTCEEDFLSDPNNWCGDTHDPPIIAWSNDSLFVAAITSTGGLVSFDVRRSTQPFDVCLSSCTDKFGFQP